jgi:hypothetical protein
MYDQPAFGHDDHFSHEYGLPTSRLALSRRMLVILLESRE